jgi:hypothetical protein
MFLYACHHSMHSYDLIAVKPDDALFLPFLLISPSFEHIKGLFFWNSVKGQQWGLHLHYITCMWLVSDSAWRSSLGFTFKIAHANVCTMWTCMDMFPLSYLKHHNRALYQTNSIFPMFHTSARKESCKVNWCCVWFEQHDNECRSTKPS